jgi:hypothetical protein
LSLLRTVARTTLYVALIAGSVVLLFAATAGLYIAALAMVILGVYSDFNFGSPSNARPSASSDHC